MGLNYELPPSNETKFSKYMNTDHHPMANSIIEELFSETTVRKRQPISITVVVAIGKAESIHSDVRQPKMSILIARKFNIGSKFVKKSLNYFSILGLKRKLNQII